MEILILLYNLQILRQTANKGGEQQKKVFFLLSTFVTKKPFDLFLRNVLRNCWNSGGKSQANCGKP